MKMFSLHVALLKFFRIEKSCPHGVGQLVKERHHIIFGQIQVLQFAPQDCQCVLVAL